MKSRVLKRPMFRMGGDVENVGIMDGMRARYSTGTDNRGVQIKGMKPGSTEITMDYRNQPDLTGNDRLKKRLGLISSLIPGPNLNQFLIDFGLNLASGVPRGNILATAAASAREPFGRFMQQQQQTGATKAALALDALDDDDMAEVEKQAEIMANNPKSEFYNDKDGALNAIMSGKIYSKSGKLAPDVAQKSEINSRAEIFLRDDTFPGDYDSAIALSKAIQNVNDGRIPGVSKEDLDPQQKYIDPEAFAEKTEDGIYEISADVQDGEYQEGLKYYNLLDGKFYTFTSNQFVPVTTE